MIDEHVKPGLRVTRTRWGPVGVVGTVLSKVTNSRAWLVEYEHGGVVIREDWTPDNFEAASQKTDLEIACSIGDRLRKENAAWRDANEDLRAALEAERQKNMRLGDELGLAAQTARGLDLTVATSLGRLETSDAELRVAKAKIKRLEDEIRRLKWSRG